MKPSDKSQTLTLWSWDTAVSASCWASRICAEHTQSPSIMQRWHWFLYSRNFSKLPQSNENQAAVQPENESCAAKSKTDQYGNSWQSAARLLRDCNVTPPCLHQLRTYTSHFTGRLQVKIHRTVCRCKTVSVYIGGISINVFVLRNINIWNASLLSHWIPAATHNQNKPNTHTIFFFCPRRKQDLWHLCCFIMFH